MNTFLPQPLDADLTAIAAVATAAFGRSLLAEASAATLKTALSLNQVENAAASGLYLPLAGGTLTGTLIGTNITTVGATTLSSSAIGVVPLVAKGFTSQTAALQQWQDSAGTVLASFNASCSVLAMPTSFAIGVSATTAGGANSIALGQSASSTGTQTVAVGYLASAAGNASVAIGFGATANTGLSVAVGVLSVASANSVAIGYSATSSGGQSIAIGQTSIASHAGSCVVGPGAQSFATYEFVSGHYSAAAEAMSFRLTGVTGDTIARVSVFNILNTFVDTAAATLKVRSIFNAFDTAAREAIRIEGNGSYALCSIGGGVVTASTALTVLSPTATYKPLVVKGATSQSANLQEWQNSAGTLLAAIKSDGFVQLHNAAVAATPTATHTVTIKDSNGTTYRLLCVI